jgi:hypothetical protein
MRFDSSIAKGFGRSLFGYLTESFRDSRNEFDPPVRRLGSTLVPGTIGGGLNSTEISAEIGCSQCMHGKDTQARTFWGLFFATVSVLRTGFLDGFSDFVNSI